MKVTLNSGELATAHLMAIMRRCVNQATRINDKRRAHDAIDIDMTGAIAEIAWAKAWNIYPDLTCAPRAGSADSILAGKRIDIKATKNPRGQLLAHIEKPIDAADIYVLAIVDNDLVDFVGYATATELINPDTITNLGHGDTYALPQTKLRTFKCDQITAG
jgi:hypothetical protein